MKRLSIVVALLLAAFMLLEPASAQNRKAGINSAAFLKVGVGARQVALGSAATSLTGDVTNMYWNPAGIALTDSRAQASFMYNKWLADIKHNALAVSYNFEDIGTIGIGVMTFGVSDIPADRDIVPGLESIQQDFATSSTYDYLDLMAQVTYARYLTDQLSLGASVKYINEKIDDQNASAVAFDLGSVYHIGMLDWNIAARVSNLGSDIKFYDFGSPIPLTFSIGTSMAPYKDDMNRIMVAVDMVKPQDGRQYFFGGLEYTFMNMISVRGGYKFNYSGTNDGGSTFQKPADTTIEDFTAGAGFNTELEGYALRLDYAYTKMNVLSATHRISLSVGMK